MGHAYTKPCSSCGTPIEIDGDIIITGDITCYNCVQATKIKHHKCGCCMKVMELPYDFIIKGVVLCDDCADNFRSHLSDGNFPAIDRMARVARFNGHDVPQDYAKEIESGSLGRGDRMIEQSPHHGYELHRSQASSNVDIRSRATYEECVGGDCSVRRQTIEKKYTQNRASSECHTQ